MATVKTLEIEGTFVKIEDLENGNFVIHPNKYYINGQRVSEEIFCIEQEIQRNIYYAANGIKIVTNDDLAQFSYTPSLRTCKTFWQRLKEFFK